MQAILLAGGLGTRLKSVVSDRPKPMALIGEKPFMEYVIHELSCHGIADIIFAIGYKGSMVESHFGDGCKFGVTVSYAYEETLLGTAGAIKNAARHMKEDKVFVLNADTFYQIDYTRLLKLWEEKTLDMALVLREVPDVSRYGEATLKDNCLTGFNEKVAESRPGTINGGIYLISRELIEDIPQGKVSLEREMIPKWLEEGRRMGGIVNDGYFIDIGIPEDYYRFIKDVERGAVIW